MKILVKFDKEIGLEEIQKELSPNQTVENLEVLISLNYAEMNNCKLVFNGNTLKNKDAKLRQVMVYVQPQPSESQKVYQVYVVKKGDLDDITDLFTKVSAQAQQNPLIAAGILVGLLFLFLFLFGSSSSNQQFN